MRNTSPREAGGAHAVSHTILNNPSDEDFALSGRNVGKLEMASAHHLWRLYLHHALSGREDDCALKVDQTPTGLASVTGSRPVCTNICRADPQSIVVKRRSGPQRGKRRTPSPARAHDRPRAALLGLNEYEARQIVQESLGRIPEVTSKQILKHSADSMRRLAHLLERLRELHEINGDCELDDLVPLAGQSLLAPAR